VCRARGPTKCSSRPPSHQLALTTAVARRRLNMALGLLNWAIAELKGEFDNVASWSEAIKAMGVFGAHGSMQSQRHRRVRMPMECADSNPWKCAQRLESVQSRSHGVCGCPKSVQSRSHGSVRSPWRVCKSPSHGVCGCPWSAQSQSHGSVRSAMECAEPKPWSAEPHGVCKAKAT